MTIVKQTLKQVFQTKNLSGKLLKESQKYIEELKEFPEVVGILITGGLARGFVDKFSDVDIELFLHTDGFEKWKEKTPVELRRRISEGNFRYGNEIVEIEFFNYDDYLSNRSDFENWTMANKWDKSYAKIAYDPKGKIKKLLSTKVVFHPGELKNSKKRAYRYAYWFGNMVAESWIERGDIVSAHTSINFALENLVDYLFLENKQFIPHRKWKFFYVKRLKVLPQNFSEKLGTLLLVEANTVKSVNKRIDLFEILLKEAENLFKKSTT